MKKEDQCPTIKIISSLTSWPETVPTGIIECAGEAYLQYVINSTKKEEDGDETPSGTTGGKGSSENDEDASKSDEKFQKLKSGQDLSDLTFYDILNIPMHASANEVRQAYHKCSLLYHPDKADNTVDREHDEIFLKVKEAFETLGDTDKRRAYDSSLEFDESIPSQKDVESDEDFYELFGDCFERNMRFALSQKKYKKPPVLGNDNTPMTDVESFYDYWTHFESWRDFSRIASELLKHDVDMADGRDEKRWMQKEIDRKAKAMKKEEMSRIATLVERALALDPRLRRQRQREKAEKEKAKEEKRLQMEKEQQEKQQREQEEKKREEERLQKEKQEREIQKQKKDAEKKQMRKVRQSFRKATLTAFQQSQNKVWEDMDAMHDDVELLCERLTFPQLTNLLDKLLPNNAPESCPSLETLPLIQQRAAKLRAADKQKKTPAKKIPKQKKPTQTKLPWTKEELSALSKAIKKYPTGSSNRWETIANYINTALSLNTPRSKEECISQYNSIAHAPSSVPNAAAAPKEEEWTEEQDKQLQKGLAAYPASMDKNERWTNIAKGVTGKSKKECVGRYKVIREAIKSKQQDGK